MVDQAEPEQVGNQPNITGAVFQLTEYLLYSIGLLERHGQPDLVDLVIAQESGDIGNFTHYRNADGRFARVVGEVCADTEARVDGIGQAPEHLFAELI